MRERLDRVNDIEQVAFHIAGAARVDAAIANLRLERRREPEFERFHGLNIVMPIDQDARLRRIDQPFAVHDGMPVAGHDLDVRHPGTCQAFGDPVGRGSDIDLPRWIGTNTGQLQELDELIEVGRLVGGQNICPRAHSRSRNVRASRPLNHGCIVNDAGLTIPSVARIESRSIRWRAEYAISEGLQTR